MYRLKVGQIQDKSSTGTNANESELATSHIRYKLPRDVSFQLHEISMINQFLQGVNIPFGSPPQLISVVPSALYRPAGLMFFAAFLESTPRVNQPKSPSSTLSPKSEYLMTGSLVAAAWAKIKSAWLVVTGEVLGL